MFLETVSFCLFSQDGLESGNSRGLHDHSELIH